MFNGTDEQLKNALSEIARRDGGQRGAIAQAALDHIENLEGIFGIISRLADKNRKEIDARLEAEKEYHEFAAKVRGEVGVTTQ